jgi:prepilin-type N-terminal cleavage/methylation domain-containing protein
VIAMRTPLLLSPLLPPLAGRKDEVPARLAFTLIELLVVIVIITILASLSLAGLAGARQRAKIDKTKSTIRKLHETLLPQYEGYASRRVPLPSSSGSRATIAQERLERLRTIALYEMPDSWLDTTPSAISATLSASTDIRGPVYGTTISGTIPAYAFTAKSKAYGAFRQAAQSAAPGKLSHTFRSSECLFLIATRGIDNASVLENFRGDEIGDVDADSAPEFIDGWGNPIAFIRWPTGFVSPLSQLQINNPNLAHDPWDPMRVEEPAFSLTPLVYSAGPDTEYGLVQLTKWTGESLLQIFQVTDDETNQRPGEPYNDPVSSGYYRDNITNHDLMSKR